ncbi:MAG: hypothetical protein MUF29_10215 [Chitinophagaceae bacterium]|jgi:hypothetical protein|nr:hypothetical protein [Chitinophagaceae bacterium]
MKRGQTLLPLIIAFLRLAACQSPFAPAEARPPAAQSEPWGQVYGKEVQLYTLTNRDQPI